MDTMMFGDPLDHVPARKTSSEYLALLDAFDTSDDRAVPVEYDWQTRTPEAVYAGFKSTQRRYPQYAYITVSRRGDAVYLSKD